MLLISQIGTCLGFILMGTAMNLTNALQWLFVARPLDPPNVASESLN